MAKTLFGVVKDIDVQHFKGFSDGKNYYNAKISVWAQVENQDSGDLDDVFMEKREGLDTRSIEQKTEEVRAECQSYIGEQIEYKLWKNIYVRV